MEDTDKIAVEEISFIQTNYIPCKYNVNRDFYSNLKFPQTILISENENTSVSNLKKILLECLKIEEFKYSTVSLSRISNQVKHLHTLRDDSSINGIKAINKFVYAFEINKDGRCYKCFLCKNCAAGELKLNIDCNCIKTICNNCLDVFKRSKIPFECCGCGKETVITSFKTVGKYPQLSILNVPIVLAANNFDENYKYELKDYQCLITLKINDALLEKNIDSVHLITNEVHDCLESDCYLKSSCSAELKLENLVNQFKMNNLDSVDVDLNDKNILEYFGKEREEETILQIDKLDVNINDKNILEKEREEETISQIDKLDVDLNEKNILEKDREEETISQIDKLDVDLNDKNILEKDREEETISQIDKLDADLNDNNILEIEQEEKSSSETDLSHSDRNELTMKEQIAQIEEENIEKFREQTQKLLKESLENVKLEFGKMINSYKMNNSQRNLQPFEKLKYSGSKDFKHPVRFIRDFEFFANRENLNDYEKQFFLGQSLIEGAEDWLKISGFGETYESMKESFLECFWSDGDQAGFRAFLKHGKYSEKTNLSMYVYFHKYSSEANFLDNAPDEEQLVKWLCEHFDTIVKSKLYGNHVRTIKEALQTLKNLENSDVNYNLELEVPWNFFSCSTEKKSKIGIWEDHLRYKYDVIKKNGETFYRCLTTKIWPMHTLNCNNSMQFIKHFDVTCDEHSANYLSNVPEKLYHVFLAMQNKFEAYEVLGPITIAKQNDRQLIVSTCSSFRAHTKLRSGLLLFCMNDEKSFHPCGIITCSIPEDFDYRYIISNNNEQIVCLLCKEKIEQIKFCTNRPVAVQDLIVRYFEQNFFKEKHVLRFLNEEFCIIYTVWDSAKVDYNPLEPVYH